MVRRGGDLESPVASSRERLSYVTREVRTPPPILLGLVREAGRAVADPNGNFAAWLPCDRLDGPACVG